MCVCFFFFLSFCSVDAWTLAFSPDSQYLATGTHVGKVNIFGVESGKKEYSLDTRGKFILSIAYVRKPCSLLCLPLFAVCASGLWPCWGQAAVWRARGVASRGFADVLWAWPNNTESQVLSACSPQSPDGKYLASGAIDGIINIFDIATGKLLHTLEGVAHFLLCNWVIRPQRENCSFIKMLLNDR